MELHFESAGPENANPGYYIKLEALSYSNSPFHRNNHNNDQDKQTVIAKVTKLMKHSAFQFSYDQVNKRFRRELRDKDNKEIFVDKLFQ